MTRPTRTCPWCGGSSRSGDGTCRSCKALTDTTKAPRHEDALTGGRWVPHRGVQVWVADQPTKAPIVVNRPTLLEAAAQLADIAERFIANREDAA